MNTINNAIKNSLLSFILGDVIGTPVQFMQRDILKEYLSKYSYFELIKRRENVTPPFGSWSDDSSMTLCTMLSITELGTINIDNIVKYFIKWLYEDYMTPTGRTFDVGQTTIKSLNRYLNANKTIKNHIIPYGLDDISSNGNGSLMRILPISLYCYFKHLSDKETFEIIKNVSSITHAHPISVLGCYIYTLIVFDILNGKTKDDIIKNLKNTYDNKIFPNEYKEWLDEYSNILNGNIINESADQIDSSGYVKSTLGVALWGFYNTNSVEECIFRIIELGQDTDTNAAIGAGLSGLYYGIKGKFVKQEWIDKIINKNKILELIDKYIYILD